MNKKLKTSLKKFNKKKEDKLTLWSGELGIPLNGTNTVEVPGRAGFVFVRLKGNTSELIQAYNAAVSPIYGLPVLLARQTGVYKIIGRNLDRYQDWGNAPYLPKHGGQHSFNPTLNIGGDVAWIYSQQFMPLLSYPSGTNGGMTLSIEPHFYEWNGSWRYAQNTGTPSYAPYLPTITGSARMVLSYIDPVDNSIKLVPGTPFSNLITGSAQIAPYIPDIPRSVGIPLAAVRLVTGTTTIGWNNIYDVRDFYTVGVASGSSGGAGGGIMGLVGKDEGVFVGTGTILNVVGAGATLTFSGTTLNLEVPGGGVGGSGLGIMGQDEGIPLGTGTTLNVTGAGATLSLSGTVLNLNVPGGGGSAAGLGVMAWDEGVPLGTGTVFNFVGSNINASISGSVVRVFVTGSSGGGDHSYYQYLAATLEPDAIEKFNTGTFTYTVGGSETKLLMACWKLQIGGSGRFELRDTSKFLPLRDVSITGLAATSFAIIIDPTLPTYTDARQKYLDRLVSISQLKTKFSPITAASTSIPILFLPGPYGSIITSLTTHNLAWAGVYLPNAGAVPMQPEKDDTDALRIANPMHFTVDKKFCGGLLTGLGRSDADGNGSGGVTFVTLPSTWSVFTDATSYNFRDDFMGTTLDTATKWTRAESTAGNVEINTLYQWLKLIGNTNWGTNGCFSQTSVTRASGKIFLCDIWLPSTTNHALIVGWHDGAGQNYTDFSHGMHFGGSGAVDIYENGNARGTVGSGWTAGKIYRVRITLDVAGANSAKYEIQGGAYPPISGAVWQNITPATTSSSTSPVSAGASMYVGTGYVSDVKIY